MPSGLLPNVDNLLDFFFVDLINAAALVDHAAGDEVSADRRGDHQKHGDQQFMQAQAGFKGAEMEHPSVKKLGPEATDPETFSAEYIIEKASKLNKTIKEFLLDQEIVCGIGNIYADYGIHRLRNLPDCLDHLQKVRSRHCDLDDR